MQPTPPIPLSSLEPSLVADPAAATGGEARAMRILAQDPGAFTPGYQPVPEAVNRAIAEHGLRTLSSVDLD